jgi:hypothetical protein
MTIEENIAFEIEHRFYYIEHPDGVGENLWKDREGKIHLIDDMGLDHLKAAIHLIEKNIAAFNKHWKEFSNGPEVIKELLPLAESKLSELKEVFAMKAKS